MADKRSLQDWILKALHDLGGDATVVEVSRWVWTHHEGDLRKSDDLFYTWQYDLRWAAQKLRDEGVLAPTARGRASSWRLASPSDQPDG